MKKRVFYTEFAYVLGVLALALGTALMERANFGVSMVVAPAYILHLKISQFLPFFSFGMAEYTLQSIILVIMMILLRKVKLSYFFSFVTTVIYGLMLDAAITGISLIPFNSIPVRLLFYVSGMLICSAGVSFMFHTYISPAVYELFVKEVSSKMKADIHKFKTVYDCTSCVIGIILSFIFFGLWQFEGVKLGTVVCALLNGFFISLFTKLFERFCTFEDRFALKKYF